MKERARRLYEDGKSLDDIAKELKKPASTIRVYYDIVESFNRALA